MNKIPIDDCPYFMILYILVAFPFKFIIKHHLPFRVVTLLIYMSEIPLLDKFSYLLLTEQFTGIIPVGHQTFVSALKIPAMKISKNLFIPFSICPANREFHILSTI